jgi:hypothetical protein
MTRPGKSTWKKPGSWAKSSDSKHERGARSGSSPFFNTGWAIASCGPEIQETAFDSSHKGHWPGSVLSRLYGAGCRLSGEGVLANARGHRRRHRNRIPRKGRRPYPRTMPGKSVRRGVEEGNPASIQQVLLILALTISHSMPLHFLFQDTLSPCLSTLFTPKAYSFLQKTVGG